MLKKLAVLCAVALPAACGGGGGVGPTDLPSAAPVGATMRTLTFYLGPGGDLLSSGQVMVGGEIKTLTGGRVQASVSSATPVVVSGSGILTRETLARNDSEFHLFTLSGEVTDQSVREIIHAGMGSAVSRPLTRIMSAVVSLQPSTDISNDAEAMDNLRTQAANITALLGGRIVYTVGGTGGVVVRLSLDPTLGARAATNMGFRSGEYVLFDGGITFRDLSMVRNPTTTLHELGHTFGLYHSSDRGDLMFGDTSRSAQGFSFREQLIGQMMLLRLPGNQYPDNDTMVSASSVSAFVRGGGGPVQTITHVCH